MAEQTAIEWCDATFNPWIGCTKVSIAATGGGGCDHCYAEVSTPARVKRAAGIETWGPRGQRQRTSAHNWRQPLVWNAQTFVQCAQCGWRGDLQDFESDDGWTMCPTCSCSDWHGARRRVFCASLADVFDNAVPIEWLRDLCSLIETTPNLDWLLLTKRIGNAFERLIEARSHDWLAGRQNVILGATVVNQLEYDRDIGKLLRTPARRRFLSIEPMLGPIDMRVGGASMPDYSEHRPLPRIDWVICGGESGHNARPMHPDWARSLRDQCAAVGTPFLFKQWGEWLPAETDAPGDGEAYAVAEDGSERELAGRLAWCAVDEQEFLKTGKKIAGRLLDGAQHDGFPCAA